MESGNERESMLVVGENEAEDMIRTCGLFSCEQGGRHPGIIRLGVERTLWMRGHWGRVFGDRGVEGVMRIWS